MAVGSGSGYYSGHADESKAQCLLVLTCKTPSGLLVLLAALSPDTGLPGLCGTRTHSFLQHLLFFQPQVLPYLACTTFFLQPCSSVCAPLFIMKSNQAPARAEQIQLAWGAGMGT